MSQAIATKEAVESACSKIYSREQRLPTYDEVARELKGGSNSTIGKYLREWLSKRERAARASLPQSLQTRCLTIAQEVWSEATAAAAAMLNAERLQVGEELRHTSAHIDELVVEIEELQRQRDSGSVKISELMIEVARREAILHQQAALEAANARVRQERDELRHERDDARVTVARLEGQLAELHRQLAEVMSTKAARVGRRRLQANGQQPARRDGRAVGA
jgi:chromosome segregation ATPase